MLACLLGAHTLTCVAQDLALSDTQLDRLGIRAAPTSVATVLEVANLSAEVQLPVAGIAAVAAPYAGRVLRVEVDEGDAVRRG
jgi:biotin carboxyl carrier protein